MENGYIESFNGRLRDELLSAELFLDIGDARMKLDAWRRDDNGKRPHSALSGMTPKGAADSPPRIAHFPGKAHHKTGSTPVATLPGAATLLRHAPLRV
jgi:hypothetical protein